MATANQMTLMNNGGAAFPSAGSGSGMNLRDYFAAAALPAVLAKHAILTSQVASAAYDVAEALLEERKKRYLP